LNKPKAAIALVLSVRVLEDLAMAVYLPIVGVLLLGGDLAKLVLSVAIAITAVALVLVAAVRYGRQLSQFAAHESDEIILLTIFGVVLLVAGMAQRFQVSAPIGAFLVGYWAAGMTRIDKRGRLRAGIELIARGEFSVVIAGLGVAIVPGLGPLSAAYVLFLAIMGPILARLVK
jgi:Kef-type K+ transport system membrane component KefB